MAADHRLILKNTKPEELKHICEMELGEARKFIIPYTIERHQTEFEKPDVAYKSVLLKEGCIGFLILVLDADGHSVEFRRIVITKPGRGYGKQVVDMVDRICRDELGRNRIWLDVFETNNRAHYVYEQCGYKKFGKTEYEGRTLFLYEKMV